MKRAFPLEDVLSVLHDRQFSRTEHGVSELMAFLTSGPKMRPESQILLSGAMQVKDDLRVQLPELTAATTPPARFVSEASAWNWIEEMEKRHGATVEVEPVIYR